MHNSPEIAIVGSNIQMVVGTAIATNLLSAAHIPLWAGIVITAAEIFAFLLLENLTVRRLEALFAALNGVMVRSVYMPTVS